MTRAITLPLTLCALLLQSWRAIAQLGSGNFDKVWIQGQQVMFSTSFQGTDQPLNQIHKVGPPKFITHGNSGICDSLGNLLLVCDGYNLYDKNLNFIDNGQLLSPGRIINFNNGFNAYGQASIILPFGNGKYRLITPTVSDDSCIRNWEQVGNGAYYDIILYNEIDMYANLGAGKVTKRMVPMLQNARLSKTQMMACRHGDGKSWWLFKQAADTNLIYKFLLTEDKVYGPYLQGFSGVAARLGALDISGQAMFSKDGTKYATTNVSFSNIFLADFDRCSGLLSNPKVYKVPPRHTGNPLDSLEVDSTTVGLCFSPNGKYLYVSGFNNIQQLDLTNPSSPCAWTRLSGHDTSWNEFQLYSNIYLGHDGRIYISARNGLGGQMSVINSPDSLGLKADFCPKCLRFPGYLIDTVVRFVGVTTPPCMPNYSLGPTSPICYPAGIETPRTEQALFCIYPNPTKGTIQVNNTEAGSLNILDMDGRIISTHIMYKASSGIPIDLHPLPPGIYLYHFKSESGALSSGKLVLMQ